MEFDTQPKASLQWYIAAGLAGFALLIYLPTLWYGFIFDDLPTITNYIHIKEFNPISLFFSSTRWVPRLLDQVTYHFWGIQPFAYRFFNLFLHLSIGILLFFLTLRLCQSLYRWYWIRERALFIATIAASLFLLHPTQTQTATYIIQMRLEGLATFGALLVLVLFVKTVDAATEQKSLIWYVISLITTSIVVGTKEVIVVLPILLMLVDWFFIAQGDWGSFKRRWKMHLGYVVVIFGLLAYLGLIRPRHIASLIGAAVHNNRGNILTAGFDKPITFYPFCISQFKVLLHYLWIFVWPFYLCFDYEMKLSQSVFDRDVLVPFFVLVALFTMMLLLLKKDKAHPVVFGVLWFFIVMVPRASIFPSTELICDYKTYMASPGIFFLFALTIMWAIEYGAQRLSQFIGYRITYAKYYACGLLLVALASMTLHRNFVWSSEFVFWKDVIEKSPNKSRGYNNYAVALMELGKVDEAIDAFEKAVARDAWYAEPHINLATIWHSKGQRDRAMTHYSRAFEIGEAHPELFHNLGLFHLEGNALDRAQLCFEQAIALRPYYSRALTKLGQIYQCQGKIKEAYALFGRALNGDAPDQEVCLLYAAAAQELGNFDEAINILKQIEKNCPQATFFLGCCYYNKRDYKTACSFFDAVYQRQRNDPLVAYNYALALMHSGDCQRALGLFTGCSKDQQNLPFASLHEIKCLHEVGKKEAAARALHELLKKTLYKEVKRDALTLAKELKIKI